MEKRTFSVILFLLCIFLFVPKAQAIDAGFENKLLKARPLSELVGERPLPVSESYFLCMDERN
ncbi:MAG: hypothetical protein IJR49_06355, partial [Treponema sp.]|nr:hypothetical protein [Treponema sp.]